MALGTYMVNPVLQFFDNSGNLLTSGTLTFYQAGTSTLLDTFSDVGLLTANPNPLSLNSAGRPSVSNVEVSIFFSAASYKVVLKNSAGTTLATRDNLGATPTTAVDLDVDGVAGEALAANDAVFLSDGTGGRTAGRWYKTDADTASMSSTAVTVAMVPTAIASAATGSIRLQGRLTGFVGLTVGSNYYLSATAGAITASAPANARFVGVADTTTSLVLTPSHSLVNSNLTVASITSTTSSLLKFPAAQSASSDANTLDDYEEGSWTPSVGGSGGESGQVYATQIGRYVKVGKRVDVWFEVVLSTLGTITTAVQIEGLPFAADSFGAQFVPIAAWANLTNGQVTISGSISAGAQVVVLISQATAAAAGVVSNLVQGDLADTTTFRGAFTYQASA